MLSRVFLRDFVDEDYTYVDLAYEDHAVVTRTTGDEDPLILVRRTSCNSHDVQKLRLQNRAQHFPWHLTADGDSVRATPAIRSGLRRSSFAYMQSYNNEKDMFACTTTGGTPLFAEKALRSLAFS